MPVKRCSDHVTLTLPITLYSVLDVHIYICTAAAETQTECHLKTSWSCVKKEWTAGKEAHLPSLVMGVSSSWYICRTISAVSSLLWLFMSHNTSIARLRANSLAKSRPRPLPAPVITHTCPATLFSLGRTTHFAPAVTKAQSTFRMTTKNSAMMIIILTSLISSKNKQSGGKKTRKGSESPLVCSR